MNTKSLLLGTVVLAATAVGLEHEAHADLISIGLQESGVNGGAIDTVASASGHAVYAGTFGSFTISVVTALGSPPLAQPIFQTTADDYSSSAGTITVWITEQGLTAPTGPNKFLSGLTANLFNGSVTSVSESTLISTGNALFGGTVLATNTFPTMGSVAYTDLTPSLANPYSETVEYVVTLGSGGGSVNDTINISAVPEPASLGLLGTAMICLSYFRRKRA